MNYHLGGYGNNYGLTLVIDNFIITLIAIYFAFDKADITMETYIGISMWYCPNVSLICFYLYLLSHKI